jgi:tetratricopeptide (TPR) repeat protein
MAKIYAGKGDSQKQIEASRNAIQRGTSFLADAHILIAEGQIKLGDVRAAEASYLSALASKQDIPSIYRALGEMYRSQSRFNDAIEITRRALRIWDKDGSFYTDNSWYYSLAGRPEDAIQAAQAGIRYLPDQYMAYTNLCRAYNDVSKFELAISACNGALKLKPDDGETLFYLARANDGLNKTAEATRLYKRAVTGLVAFTRDNPTYSDAFYLLGNAYYADNQSANAIASYLRALELSPRFARARYNLAMVHLDNKDKAAALEQHRLLSVIDQPLAAKLKAEIDKAQ